MASNVCLFEAFDIYSQGGSMWGPEYYYFDLPTIKLGGMRRNVFNRWTIITAMVVVVLVGIGYSGAFQQPVPTKDKIAWGATVDPTLWEPYDRSANDVTMSLLSNRSSQPNIQVRGSATSQSSIPVPSAQVVVVAARYVTGGHKLADDYGVFNDQCTIQPGGSVYLIGDYRNYVLVGYKPPVRSIKVEGMCTGKEVFYLERTA